jgi:predicted TIM-barrel fold metal-dependent hydrolase
MSASASSRIIDFRLRPPAKGFVDMYLYRHKQRTVGLTGQVGLPPAPSVLAESMALCLDEMDRAGIAVGVALGRQSNEGDRLAHVSNDDVAQLVREYPGRFVGIASADLSRPQGAPEELERAVRELGLRGLSVEPGMVSPPMYADDPKLYPLYQRCVELEVPVILMAGGNAGPDVSYSVPTALDRMARDFPRLAVVAAHGGWPWVVPTLHVAFRRPNVYISPDMYLLFPGALDYVHAANTYLQDRFLFATAYPAAPLVEYVEAFHRLPFNPEILPKILHDNAARLLRLA